MDSLYVVAKPEFEKRDLAGLKAIREQRSGNVGPPEFTVVFPTTQMEPSAFAAFITSQAAGVQRIRFRLRSAVVVPEAILGHFHVFLVPDEGFGAIIRLHDKLHSGPLESCLRPEMPYLPHLTVATESDYTASRKIARMINAREFSIEGVIDRLEIKKRGTGDVVRIHSEVPLGKGGWFK